MTDILRESEKFQKLCSVEMDRVPGRGWGGVPAESQGKSERTRIEETKTESGKLRISWKLK